MIFRGSERCSRTSKHVITSNEVGANGASRMSPTKTFAPVLSSALLASFGDISIPWSCQESRRMVLRKAPALQPRSNKLPPFLKFAIVRFCSAHLLGEESPADVMDL